MNKITVNEFILNSGPWENGLILLREFLLEAGLEETVKWNIPVYTIDNQNIAGLLSYKKYFGIIFYQGALIKDRYQLFYYPQGNIPKILRYLKFQSANEVTKNMEPIVHYIQEAIKNQKSGVRVKPDPNQSIIIPVELQTALDNDKNLKIKFYALSLSKQRDYSWYINQAKLPATREKRLKKIIALINKI